MCIEKFLSRVIYTYIFFLNLVSSCTSTCHLSIRQKKTVWQIRSKAQLPFPHLFYLDILQGHCIMQVLNYDLGVPVVALRSPVVVATSSSCTRFIKLVVCPAIFGVALVCGHKGRASSRVFPSP